MGGRINGNNAWRCKRRDKKIKSNSVDCIVTSPPYWRLRDYGDNRQLGLEETPAEFIQNLCNIFDECYRVLKDTGTLFVNLGDSYSHSNSISTSGRRGFYKDVMHNIKIVIRNIIKK